MPKIEMTQIYLDLREPVYRFLLSMTGSPERAEEWTQETFYRALIALPRFRKESSVKTWIFSIARITFLEKTREQARKKTLQLNENYKEVASTAPTQLEQLINKEEKEALLNALAELPENYRTLLILREFEELSYAEIAYILNQTENWCRVNYFRAKQQLKKYLTKGDGSFVF